MFSTIIAWTGAIAAFLFAVAVWVAFVWSFFLEGDDKWGGEAQWTAIILGCVALLIAYWIARGAGL